MTLLFREVSIKHLHWSRLANRERLLLRTPGPVPFGTCICSNVETIHSWTCHVYGPFEFQTSLGILGSGSGRVVKLLACGARGPGLHSWSRYLNFRDWLSPASTYGWYTAKATWIPNTTNEPSKRTNSWNKQVFCYML